MKQLISIFTLLLLLTLTACAGSNSHSNLLSPTSFTISYDGTTWTTTLGSNVCGIESMGSPYLIVHFCGTTIYNSSIIQLTNPIGGGLILNTSQIYEGENEVYFSLTINGAQVMPNDPILTGATISDFQQ